MIPTDLSPLWNHLWQSTLCATAVWLLTLALRKNRAAVRYWLWFAASFKFLVPFSLLVSVASQLEWRTTPLNRPATAPAAIAVAVEQFSQPFALPVSLPAAARSTPIPAILLVLWLTGVVIGIGFLLRWWRSIQTARRAARPLPMKLPIPVMSVPSRLEPGVFGIVRPVLLLPDGIADRLTPQQLKAVIAHELCHVRRRDNLTAAIHMVVETICWFHPLVWWIRTRLVEERERACDEDVLRQADPQVYAEGILNVCKFYLESPLACASGVSGANLKRRIDKIVASHIGQSLDWRRKLLLVVAGTAAIAAPIAAGILNAPARAQSQNAATSFEVVSVKPSTGREVGGVHVFPGGRIEFRGCTPGYLIQQAFQLQHFQVSGGPAWLQDDRYDIDAKPPAASKSSQYMPPYQKAPMIAEQRQMLLQLLTERFQFQFHRETREGPVYMLVRGNKPLHMSDSKDKGEFPWAGAVRGGPPFADGIQGINESMADLAWRLTGALGKPVLDRTGISGSFDFRAEYPSGDPRPDIVDVILTSVQELGLKLQSSRGPVETIVVDHIERPSAN